MKKSIYKIIFSFFICTSIFAQDEAQENQLLKNFQYRTKGFVGLNINGIINQNNTSSDGGYYQNSNTNVNLTPNLFGNYSSNKRSTTYNIYSEIDFTNSKSTVFDTLYDKDKTFEILIPISFQDKFFGEKNKFISYGINGQINYHTERAIDLQEHHHVQNRLTPFVSVGKGRINDVEYMEKAIWIIRDLKKNNILKSQLNDNDITSFANVLVILYNTRMFDYRRKNKFALENLINEISPYIEPGKSLEAFNILQDNYYFALTNSRQSGTEYEVRAGVEDFIYHFHNINNHNTKVENSSMDYIAPKLSVSYNSYKPLSLKKQIDFGATVGYAISYFTFKNKTTESGNITTDFSHNQQYNKFYFTAFGQFTFIPSTRSNLYAGLRASYNDDLMNYYSNLLYILPTAGFNYMLTYKLRLNGGISYNYSIDIKNSPIINNRTNNFNVFLKMQYSLR